MGAPSPRYGPSVDWGDTIYVHYDFIGILSQSKINFLGFPINLILQDNSLTDGINCHSVTLYSDTILQDYVWYCTAGDKGPVGDLSSESISTHFQGLLTIVQLAQLAATR